MKKTYILGLFLALMCVVYACSDDKDGINPSEISNLTAEPVEGGIILKWEVPADSNYMYVRASYQHPVTGKKMKRNASVYVDTLLVSGLLAKDGEYLFSLSSVSITDNSSKATTIAATCLPVQPTITKNSDKILLAADNVSTNKQEASEGPIANLVNGDYTDFFHSSWNNPGTEPHYIDIALPNPVELFEIKSWYRNGGYGQCPTEITVLGSNDGSSWEFIAELEDDGSGKSTYTTPVLGEEGKSYSYIRYRADKTSGNNVYFALAEMEVYKISYDIYDPEGIYQPE